MRASIRRPSGFSLVEIMVGLAIGMLAAVVMLQVFALSEERKRGATSGGDAQSVGVIALYQMQRDIRQSGQGIANVNLVGCSLPLASGGTINALAPVIVNPPAATVPVGDANTDTLLVVYADAGGSTQGDAILAQATQKTYTVTTPTSFHASDWIIAAPLVRASPCNLTAEKVLNTPSVDVTVTTGVAGVANGAIYNLGQNPTALAYRVHKGNLTVCDYMVKNCGADTLKNDDTVWVPIANNIVSMRAQYGRDTSATIDSVVDLYDGTTPVSTSTTYACDWMRISALRLAIVARSSQFEKTAVTTAAPVWAGTNTDSNGSVADPIDLTKNWDNTANPDWQNYRYKLFQTVVPIRNVAWMGVQSGC